MKSVMCLVFLAFVAFAAAMPYVDPIVSEAKLALKSHSDLLTYGNGMYNPVRSSYYYTPIEYVAASRYPAVQYAYDYVF